MTTEAIAAESGLDRARLRALDYLALTKPRVMAMVLVTTLAGFYLGSGATFDSLLAIKLLVGTALAAGGTLCLNQYIERELDAKMDRTKLRPLPDGRLHPGEALAFGIAITIGGCTILWFAVNWLSAALVAAVTVIYLFGYTPLKRVSWICNLVGAVPGALPPVAGWAAARGTIGAEPMALFAIMFLWQLPHSLAIARLYQSDYAKAGIHLLPAEGPRFNKSGWLIVGASVALVAAGMMPALLGYAGVASLIVAAAMGMTMVFYGMRLASSPAAAGARRMMLASLVYLPAVLLVLVLDKV